MRSRIFFFILVAVPVLSFSQRYNRYISRPPYNDSVTFFTYTEGFRKSIRDSIRIDKEVIKVDNVIQSKIKQKCSGKLFPFYVKLDSTLVEEYKREVGRMQKLLSVNGCIKDKTYLQVYRGSDSFIVKLKKNNSRFFIGVYYHYAYNDSTIQSYLVQNNKLHISRGEKAADVVGSERRWCLFVIDLTTGYLVYYQMFYSKHFRATAPTSLDIDLDFYSTRRFFRGIKKQRSYR